jgi:hypothetical protein
MKIISLLMIKDEMKMIKDEMRLYYYEILLLYYIILNRSFFIHCLRVYILYSFTSYNTLKASLSHWSTIIWSTDIFNIPSRSHQNSTRSIILITNLLIVNFVWHHDFRYPKYFFFGYLIYSSYLIFHFISFVMNLVF